jgi:hypothetical protein
LAVLPIAFSGEVDFRFAAKRVERNTLHWWRIPTPNFSGPQGNPAGMPACRRVRVAWLASRKRGP